MPAKKSPANQTLGEAIRSAREYRGYTQEGFARTAGMDRSYYGAVERGERNVSLTNIIRIASALKTPPAKLFAQAESRSKFLGS